jgi:peptide subunit release factor RF-3
MNPNALEEELTEHVQLGLMKPEQMYEILEQRDLFELKREEIEANYPHKVVGLADGRLFVGKTVHEIFEQVKTQCPGKLVYLEPIRFEIS